MSFSNILIFRTGFLGDTLVSLPAFWAVRKAYPHAKLTLLSNSANAGSNLVLAQSILPVKGLFNEWITYPGGNGKLNSIKDFSALFFEIRKRKFDLVIYLMTRNRSVRSIKRDTLFFKAAGVKRIIGTKYLSENLLTFEAKRPLPKVEPEFEFFFNCLKTEGLPVEKDFAKPEMLLTEEEKSFAENWLEINCHPLNTDSKLIAIAPGSKWSSKIWNAENYFQVLEKLTFERNIFPIIFGGREDRETGEKLIRLLGKGANAAGELNIRQAAAALAKCALYLGNDTGTMHLAASVGVPCVGVFAAIDFEDRWHPFGENHRIIRKKVDCEGCHSPISFNNNKCLRLVKVEEVYHACINILDQAY